MNKLKQFPLVASILMALFSFMSLVQININGKPISLAGLTVVIGLIAFFITRNIENDEADRGVLNIKAVPVALRDKWTILLILLPLFMDVLCIVIARFAVPVFIEHLRARTDFLSINLLPLLILQLLLAAWGEEIAWRGFFLKQLTKVVPLVPAVIISSVLFGFAHYTMGIAAVVWYDLLFVVINTVCYSLIFHRTNNIFVSTLAFF